MLAWKILGSSIQKIRLGGGGKLMIFDICPWGHYLEGDTIQHGGILFITLLIALRNIEEIITARSKQTLNKKYNSTKFNFNLGYYLSHLSIEKYILIVLQDNTKSRTN